MNKIFRVIWNQATQSWVAVSELSKAKGKTKSSSLSKLGVMATLVGTSFFSVNTLAAVVIGEINAEGKAVVGNVKYVNKDGTPSDRRPSNTLAIGDDLTIGSFGLTTAGGGNNIALGNNIINRSGDFAGIAPRPGVAIGNGVTSTGNGAITIGTYGDWLGFGEKQQRTYNSGADSIAIGANTHVGFENGAEVDSDNVLGAVAIGSDVRIQPGVKYGIALGDNAAVYSSRGTALGARNTIAYSEESVAIGAFAQAGTGKQGPTFTEDRFRKNDRATEISGKFATAVGPAAKALNERSSAFGAASYADADNATAIGRHAYARANAATALGSLSNATGDKSIAIGGSTTRNSAAAASGQAAIAVGSETSVGSENGLAVGVKNNLTADAKDSGAVGYNNKIAQNNTYVVGNNVTTSQANSVVLGNSSSDRAATVENSATVNGITYSGFAGQGAPAKGVVSVGSIGNERQLINVAAGNISATSTDAINGSQLYLTQNALGNLAKAVQNNLGGGATLNPNNGTVTAPTYTVNVANRKAAGNEDAIDPANNVGQALTNLNTYVNRGFQVLDNGNTVKSTVTPGEAVQFVDGKNTKANVTAENALGVTKVTFDVDLPEIKTEPVSVNASTGKATGNNGAANVANENALVTAKNVIDAVNNSFWKVTSDVEGGKFADNGHSKTDASVKAGDTVKLQAGKNLTVKQAGTNFTFATQNDVNFDSVQLGNNGPKITNNDGNIKLSGPNGNTPIKITNLADGTDGKDAVNLSQLNQVKELADKGWGIGDTNATKISDVKPGNQVNFVGSDTVESVVVKSNDGQAATNVTFNVKTGEASIDNASGKVNVPADGGKNLVNVTTLANAVNNASWTLKEKGQDKDKITAGDAIDFVDGQGTKVNITTANNNVSTVKFDIDSAEVKDLLKGDISVESNKAKTDDAADSKLATTSDVVNAINNTGWKLGGKDSTGTPSSSVVKPDSQVTFVDGNNTQAIIDLMDPNNPSVSVNVKTTDLPVGNDGKISTVTNGDQLVNATTVSKAINESGWVSTIGGNISEKQVGAVQDRVIKPSDKISFKAGDNLVVQQDGNDITYSTANNVTFTNVNATEGVRVVGGPSLSKDGIDANGKKITNVSTAVDGNDAVNLNQLNSTVQNSSWNLKVAQGSNEATNVQDGKVNPNDNVVIRGLDSVKVEAGTASNGSDYLVNISVSSEKISANPATGKVGAGDAGVSDKVTDPNALVKAQDVIDAVNQSGFTLSVGGQQGSVVNPGEKVDLSNKDGNIIIEKSPDNNNVTFKLNDVVHVGPQDGGISIDGTNKTISGLNSTLPTNNVNNGVAPSNIDTSKVATVSDVLNAGWNLKENNVDKDFVKAYDTVNFVNGTSTIANVSVNENGTIANVTFNVLDTVISVVDGSNTAANAAQGKVVAPSDADKNKFVTAGNIADAINKTGFTFKVNSDDGEFVNPGDVIDFKDGKNIKITRNGGNFTIATDENATFTTINVPTDPANPTNSPIAITKDGISAGNKVVSNVGKAADVYTDPDNRKGLTNLTDATDGNALTVADAKNMGWIVSSNKTTDKLGEAYTAQVRNAQEVEFVGTGLATVSGKSDNDKRTITVDVNAQRVIESAQLPVVYTKADGSKVYKQADGSFNEKQDGLGATVAADQVIASMNSGANATTTPTTLANVKGNLPVTTNKVGTTEATVSQLAPDFTGKEASLNNAATVGDVLNAGWNLKENNT
ncbi:ESPR-type extended signal peptide-containing protein, partial [Otariodibacter oris]